MEVLPAGIPGFVSRLPDRAGNQDSRRLRGALQVDGLRGAPERFALVKNCCIGAGACTFRLEELDRGAVVIAQCATNTVVTGLGVRG